VAQVCLDALELPAAIGRILEITSGEDVPKQTLADWLIENPTSAI
jgi:hypothetical protein